MLYICIPTHDEAPTIGVLLWRIRTLFQEYSREYEVVVCDDGSTDATQEVLEPYAKVLPLTLLGSATRRRFPAVPGRRGPGIRNRPYRVSRPASSTNWAPVA